MKKLILFFGIMAVFAILIAQVGMDQKMPVLAMDVSVVSGVTDSAGTVAVGRGYFYGIAITTDGTNNVEMNIYDGTSTTGSKIVPTLNITTSATNRFHTFSIDPPVHYKSGIYTGVTCAGIYKYTAYYKPD